MTKKQQLIKMLSEALEQAYQLKAQLAVIGADLEKRSSFKKAA